MSDEVPSEVLLARVAQHDLAALSELYDRYAPRVYGVVAHILPSRGAAEETLQQVFVRLWSESPTLSQEGSSVVAWLVLIAREAAVDRLRTQRKNAPDGGLPGPRAKVGKGAGAGPRKAKSTILLPSAAALLDGKVGATKPRPNDGARPQALRPIPSAWLPQPKEISLIDGRMVLLHKALDQLPKAQRQALELAVFGGLREIEIAAKIGEPLGKVRTALRAAVTFVKHRRRAVCGTWAANI